MKITQYTKVNLYKEDLKRLSNYKTYTDKLSFDDFNIDMDLAYRADDIMFISLDKSGNFVGAQAIKSRSGL